MRDGALTLSQFGIHGSDFRLKGGVNLLKIESVSGLVECETYLRVVVRRLAAILLSCEKHYTDKVKSKTKKGTTLA
jgi:hypothetical protein